MFVVVICLWYMYMYSTCMSVWSSTVDEPKLEGHIYVEARSYLLLEMKLAKPLVPKRPASVIASRWVGLFSSFEKCSIYVEDTIDTYIPTTMFCIKSKQVLQHQYIHLGGLRFVLIAFVSYSVYNTWMVKLIWIWIVWRESESKMILLVQC